MSQILLIEPDRLLVKTYCEALQQAGHIVRACATAQAAVFAVDKAQPDVILLEMQLVTHSGLEFLYELRSYPEWQNIPVIALSNVPPTEFLDSTALQSHELNVQIYHYKPLTSLRQLIQSVNEIAAPVQAA
jgi:CheY-like chemotaxis protein